MPEDLGSRVALICATFVVASLYSSVGHGGASGYLAVMSLFSVSALVASTTALMLNLVVASIAWFCYMKAGHFRFRFILPFIITSIPAAFLGGAIEIPMLLYNILLSVTLLWAAYRLFKSIKGPESPSKKPSIALCLVCGLVLGFVSGMVGVGGGIFLSPLILLLGWASAKETAAVSSFFIFVNSFSGLVGRFYTHGYFVGTPFIGAIAVALIGAIIGGSLGSFKITPLGLRKLLAVVLFVAAIKLIIKSLQG